LAGQEFEMPDTKIRSDMLSESTLVDLTTMVAKNSRFTSVDIALLVIGGGIGYLGKKAFEHFFPAPASAEEQIRNLVLLVEAGARAGAKKMSFRLSANTGFAAALGSRNF
jgi:hypothetical protein